MLHAGGGYRASGCYATLLEDDLLPDSDDEDEDELPPDESLTGLRGGETSALSDQCPPGAPRRLGKGRRS